MHGVQEVVEPLADGLLGRAVAAAIKPTSREAAMDARLNALLDYILDRGAEGAAAGAPGMLWFGACLVRHFVYTWRPCFQAGTVHVCGNMSEQLFRAACMLNQGCGLAWRADATPRPAGGGEAVWVPTRALALMELLHAVRPNHSLILADFSTLPDVKVAGKNAPLVAQKVCGWVCGSFQAAAQWAMTGAQLPARASATNGWKRLDDTRPDLQGV